MLLYNAIGRHTSGIITAIESDNDNAARRIVHEKHSDNYDRSVFYLRYNDVTIFYDRQRHGQNNSVYK
jgi:hypothetical protein